MDLNRLLHRAVELGASDIHLKLGSPPVTRRDGDLLPLPDAEALTDEDLLAALEIVTAKVPRQLEAFEQTG